MTIANRVMRQHNSQATVEATEICDSPAVIAGTLVSVAGEADCTLRFFFRFDLTFVFFFFNSPARMVGMYRLCGKVR